MFQHLVLMRWREDMPVESLLQIEEALRDLSQRSADLIDYQHGPNVGSDQRNWDYGVVATFADALGFARFRDDAHHLALIDRLIRPWLADRAAIQIGDAGLMT